MNSNLKIILDSYEDFELANLSHYKLPTYLEETQGSINKYLQSRGLTQSKINNLLLNTKEMVFSDGHRRCPRCKSSRLLVDRVEWAHTVGGSGRIASYDGLFGKATYKNQIVCEVCGFYIADPNKEKPLRITIRKRLYDFFFK